MGESDRYIEYKRRRISLGADGNALMMLIGINAIVYILVAFIQLIYNMMQQPAPGIFVNNVLPWFAMPAKLSVLAQRPWTVLTYMFTHIGIISTITNLLWLWAFGSILQSIAGNRKVIPVYLYGGIAGAIAFIATCNLLPAFRSSIDLALYGSGAATMAIAVATTALAPDYRFFKMIYGGIPIWVLTLLYVIIDFAGISGGAGAYNISHLSGGLIGFLFIFSMRRGYDWSAWMNNVYNWCINLFDPYKPEPAKRRIKEKVFYRTGGQKPFVKRSNITQQRIDEILDKINQKGYHLLSEEEKNILKRAGETDL